MQLTLFARSMLIGTFLAPWDPRPEWPYIEAEVLGGPWAPHLALFSSEIIESESYDGMGVVEGDEADGGGYARQRIILRNDAVPYEATNEDPCTFSSMPEGTWTHAAIMANAVAQQAILIGELTTPKNTFAGQTLTLAPGEVVFQMAGNLTEDFFWWINQFFNWVEWPDVFGDPTLHLYDEEGTEVGTPQPVYLTNPPSIDGSVWNVDPITFSGVSTGGLDIVEARLRHADADYVGDMFAGPLVAPQPDPAGGNVVFAAGDFEFTLQ